MYIHTLYVRTYICTHTRKHTHTHVLQVREFAAAYGAEYGRGNTGTCHPVITSQQYYLLKPYIYIYIHIHTYVCVCVCVCVYLYTRIAMYTWQPQDHYIYIRMYYICIYINAYKHVCVCVCEQVSISLQFTRGSHRTTIYTYVCIYIYTYIHIHIYRYLYHCNVHAAATGPRAFASINGPLAYAKRRNFF